jgi:hypothetical protein
MAMTLRDAIKHAEEKSLEGDSCECRDDHRQLAEWLRELESKREEIRCMCGYLDDVAGALGISAPKTPVEGAMACFGVMEAVYKRNTALDRITEICEAYQNRDFDPEDYDTLQQAAYQLSMAVVKLTFEATK